MSLKNSYILKNSLPIAFAYIILGFTFGVLFGGKGGSPIEAFFISALGYSGVTQFIALEFYHGGFPAIVLFSTLIVINLRHVLYGIPFLNLWQGKLKFYLFGTLTDEAFALSQVYRERKPSMFEWVKVHFLNHFYWIFGCVSGSLVPADVIHKFAGADFALIALFLSIFASTLRKK